MSLIRTSDVKKHLGATDTSVYPFGLKSADVQTETDAHKPGAEAETAGISISPSHPIAAEAVPNAQVGGSIGVPEDAE